MNDEELRKFLESATVGGDDEQPEATGEPTVVLPPVPGDPSPGERGPSFDELIGMRSQGTPQGDPDLTPIVLPGPAVSRPAAPQPPQPAVPPAPAAPAAPAVPPPVSARPAAAASTPAPVVPAAPVPAAPRASAPQDPAIEDLFPPRTATLPAVDDEYERIAVTGSERGGRRIVPWIIVGAGAVLAIVAAVLIVSSLTSGGQDPAPTAEPTTPQETPTEPAPVEPETPIETEPDGGPADDVPQVEVGPIMNMPVAHWGIQVDLSQKLGDTFYNITGENLVLTSALISSLPASCPGEWGMTRLADSSFEVLKPAERCEAAPELYDELWGLMDAMVGTARPL